MKERERPFTPLTPYLCRKWLREGWSVEEIAEILFRSPESVRAALEAPLRPGDGALMREFENRRRK